MAIISLPVFGLPAIHVGTEMLVSRAMFRAFLQFSEPDLAAITAKKRKEAS